jgi:hypothetical protein
MNYKYISLLGIFFTGMYAAEQNGAQADQTIIFTENTSGSVALNVQNCMASLLFLRRTSLAPVVYYAIVPVCECRSILRSTKELIYRLYENPEAEKSIWMTVVPDYIDMKVIDPERITDRRDSFPVGLNKNNTELSAQRYVFSVRHSYSTHPNAPKILDFDMKFDGSEVKFSYADGHGELRLIV